MVPGPPVHELVPSPGQVVAGKYRIDRLLGEGGMAFVFAATRVLSRDRVAIKVLAPDFARDKELVARFDREAHAVAKLSSPHVVRLFDVDRTESGLPFLVMEFLEGRDLEAELAERQRLPTGEAVDYVLQACAAMTEAHAAGIVHRDLKPANLFLANVNGERIVKVLDFGISKVAGATKLTAAGAIMGTVLYMSPEQIRASKDVDARTDIWSLGVILYELLAGRAPFEGSSQEIAGAILKDEVPDIRKLLPVADGIANAIHAMLQRDAAKRTATVLEAVRALGPFARAGSPGARIAQQLGKQPVSGKVVQATMPLVKGTMPMLGMAQGELTPPPRPAPIPRASQAPTTGRAPRPSAPPPSSRSPILLGAVLGFTGAMGIALIGGAWWLKYGQRPPEPAPTVAPSTPVHSAAPSTSAAAPPRPTATEPPTPASATSGATHARPVPAPAPRVVDAGAGGEPSNPTHL